MVYQQFANQNWSRGAAGTGEVDFAQQTSPGPSEYSPEIAESWKIPEPGTWILQIRKGVHYGLDPANEASRLMNGRELTADDAVYNIWRLHTDPRFPQAGPRRSHPAMSKAVTAEKTGPWEVTLKTPVDPWTGFFWVVWGGCSQMMYAKEVIEKYGHADDWTRVVGTGPFLFSDYVSQSVATFKRNPNYWQKDPVGAGKGNQLPYADTVKQFVVPDLSTRLATIRTGRADWVSDIVAEDARSLLKSVPHIKSARFVARSLTVAMRTELPDLPFKDKKVRQALAMALDYEAIKKDLYQGDAAIRDWPVSASMGDLYVPDDKLPESVRALYRYNPEGAKKLLAEAGYPRGFKTKINLQNSSEMMDPASVIKEMWAKIGVDLELQPRDFVVYTAAGTSRSWEEMRMNVSATTSIIQIIEMSPMRGVTNMINDPVVLKAYDEIQKYVFINQPKVNQIYREQVVPYVLDQAYVVPIAGPYSFTIWQPWIKNHYGETRFRWWTAYAWVDQDLKEKLTGRR